MIASPARASTEGDVEARSAAVEAVSAASSAESRDSWSVANWVTSIGLIRIGDAGSE